MWSLADKVPGLRVRVKQGAGVVLGIVSNETGETLLFHLLAFL